MDKKDEVIKEMISIRENLQIIMKSLEKEIEKVQRLSVNPSACSFVSRPKRSTELSSRTPAKWKGGDIVLESSTRKRPRADSKSAKSGK